MNFRTKLIGGLVAVVAGFASTATLAQNCTVGALATVGGPNVIVDGAATLSALAATTSAQISSSIGNATSAFQAQQGSAFVSAPANPPPDSPGGGIWGRGVGGEVTVKANSTTNLVNSAPGIGFNQVATVNCDNSIRSTFGGFQIGADTAKLNWNGWNVHLGSSAGYLESDNRSQNSAFTSTFQVPFVTTYLAATYGRFFADASVRQEFYNISLDNPGAGFFGQPISGRGWAFAVNAGYNFGLGNNWFIEPSAGFTYSKIEFDPFNSVGVPAPTPGNNISGTLALSDVESQLGRATIRIGTNLQSGNLALQPFFTASVFHEFAGDVNSTYSSCPNCNFRGPAPATFVATTATERVGTYGQYSLGLAGQVLNTGWLGFARVDYRNGENIEGWAGNAGIRYQFSPEMIAAIMPTKGPMKAMPAAARDFNWTGFYIGAHGGVGYDRTRIDFAGSAEGTKTHHAGLLGGGQIGYNYQFPNRWVIGVEADASWADLHGGRTCGNATGLDATGTPTGAFSPFFMSCNAQYDWIATATGKLGYAWGPRLLVYGKGGIAVTDETVSVDCIIGPFNNAGNIRQCRNQAGALINGISTTETRWGWVAGFGTEFAFNANWSAKSDFEYIDFGRDDRLASDGTTTLSAKTSMFVTKIGVNYRFNAR